VCYLAQCVSNTCDSNMEVAALLLEQGIKKKKKSLDSEY